MRCYFVRGGHIVGVETLSAATDDALIAQSRTLFEARKNAFDGFEVWDRARFVYRYPEPAPSYARTGINPKSLLYRLYFMAEGRRVLGQYDFPAESDAAALDVAQPVFDACSDRARSFEVWHGARLMASGAGSMTLKEIIDKRQTQVVELEERIRDSKWAVGSSQRLLERLKELKPLTARQSTREDAQNSGATGDVA